MKRSTILGVGILVTAIVLVAVRDFLLVNLNYQLDFLAHERPFSYAHSRFRAAVQHADASDLVALKWTLAVVFAALNLGLALLLARVRAGDHRYRRFLVLGFASVAAVALAAHAGSSAWPPLRPVSIMLLHALQYPVVLLLLWVASARSNA